jgi:metal-responsive CopG/Arc/MetJ family transcriptional regulator
VASQPIISASVPVDVVQSLDEIANLRGTTRSVVINQLLQFSIDQYYKAQARNGLHEVPANT